MNEQTHTQTNTNTNGATRFTYQGQEYVITADGWYGYELHQNGAGPEYVERTDHVMRMYRFYREQQYQAERAEVDDLRATQQDAERGLW